MLLADLRKAGERFSQVVAAHQCTLLWAELVGNQVWVRSGCL